jgi:hypothetical protein
MGPIYLQDLSAFLISSLAGPYAFKMESRSPFEGMDGSLIIAPNGTLNGTVDRSKSGVGPVASNLAIIGSVTAPDQFGGFSSQIGNAAFNLKFSSFVIDANRFTSMEADSGAGGALFIGDDVRQQPPVPDPTSGSYGPTSLVCRMHGSDPASGGEVFTVSQLVLTNFGSIGVTFDTNANGTIIGPATTPGTGFSFDVNSGRYAADYNNVPGWMFSSTMYFIDPNSAIILDTTPGASAQAKVGTCLAQTSPANSIVPSGNMPVEITGSNKQGTPDNLGLSGIVNADAATQKMDADFDLDITGSPTALSLAGTISFTLPDATGRGGLVLPGQFFGLQIPTVIGTYYGIDSSRFVFVSATPGVPIISGFFGTQ